MIISSLTFFLIDYQPPSTTVDPENDQNPSKQSDLIDDKADDTMRAESKSDSQEDTEANPLIKTSKNTQNTYKHPFNWKLSPI
jgi:hypothetical protein